MHPSPALSPKSRHLKWLLFGLVTAVITWIIIQTTLAASIYIIDADGSLHPSVVLINNRPVVSYYNDVSKDIMLALCGDVACTTFTNTIRTIDGTGDVGSESAMVTVDDKPVIAYTDVPNGDLKVAACSDSECSNPPTITTIDDNMIANARVAMTVVGGNPVISYYEAGQVLNIAVCHNPACTESTIRTLDSTGNVGSSSDITVINGNPIISYHDTTNQNLKVAACVDPTCENTPTITTVDAPGSVGADSSIMIVNGNPLISYKQTISHQLKVAACVDAACSNPATITTLDNIEIHRTSAALINGMPAIAYGTYSLGTYSLKLATCTTLDCTSFTLETLTGIVDAGWYPSMVNLNNQPAIAYWDNKNGQIRFYYGGDEGYGLTTTPTPSPTVTPTFTTTPSPTPYPTPAQVGTLVPATPAVEDAFGSAVAVSDDTVVVGAPYRDTNGLTDAGAAYVYQWNGTIWAFQAELVPADAAPGDNFGGAVGIYGDTIVVGAAGDDDGGSSAGSAYIFVRTGANWSQQAKLVSPDADTNDLFGHAVAISVDTVIIGAHGDSEAANGAGAAYIFVRSGTDWSLQQKLMAGDPLANAQFGYAVDLYADTAVIGAPRPDTHSGAAYVFVRPWHQTTWIQQQKLLPDPSITVGDHFGMSVAVYNETIIVGAPDAEGSVVANPSDGTVNVFNRTDGTWVRDSSFNNAVPTGAPSSEPQFAGAAVDVYREAFVAGVPGRRVSGMYPGAAFSFARWSFGLTGQWLMGTPSANNAQLGASVARDGSTVVVGAPGNDFLGQADSGAVFIFRVDAPPWEPTASMTPSLTPSPTASPTPPANASPAPNYFAVRTPTLTWHWVTWAQGYQIQIDTDPNFALNPDPFTAETVGLSYTVQTELADGIYYWRVRAKRDNGSWGSWSNTQTFIVSVP